MKYFLRKIVSVSLASLIVIGSACAFLPSYAHAATSSDTITLRVCNWEEYIDEGDWDETIDLESGDIKGENSMIADFEDWYYKTYGKKVKVEYSCLGTNEELYNMLTLGDEYDLVCPSEYMIMKLMSEDRLEPFSNDFYDKKTDFLFSKRCSAYRLFFSCSAFLLFLSSRSTVSWLSGFSYSDPAVLSDADCRGSAGMWRI